VSKIGKEFRACAECLERVSVKITFESSTVALFPFASAELTGRIQKATIGTVIAFGNLHTKFPSQAEGEDVHGEVERPVLVDIRFVGDVPF
jgi:hypothetical protein